MCAPAAMSVAVLMPCCRLAPEQLASVALQGLHQLLDAGATQG